MQKIIAIVFCLLTYTGKAQTTENKLYSPTANADKDIAAAINKARDENKYGGQEVTFLVQVRSPTWSWHWVITLSAPWVAAQDTSQGKPASFYSAIAPQCLKCIGRT